MLACALRRLLRDLAAKDPPAFICHFYNIYFAHSAGGRMIGKKVSSMCLDDAQLNFYQWDGELSDLLGKVRSLRALRAHHDDRHIII